MRAANGTPTTGSRTAKNILVLNVLLVLLLSTAAPRLRARADDASPTPELTETAAPEATNTPEVTPTHTASPSEAPDPTEETSPPVIEDEASIAGQFVPGQVVARFRRNAPEAAIQQCLRAAGASIISEIEALNAAVVYIPEGVSAGMKRLRTCTELRYAEPNYLAQADLIPSDTEWPAQYGLPLIRAPQGWDLNTGAASVTIAILDTGIDLEHADLAAKIVQGRDFVNNDLIADDDHWHGTFVAGIAAASTNNSRGVAGVSWGARLMPVKVLDASGNGSYANVAAGIVWAADNGAQVINLSLGGANGSQVLQDAINYADAAGVLIVAASGNSNQNLVYYPAAYPNVIAVAAVNGSYQRWARSNYGDEVDLAAPGEGIYSSMPGSYGSASGTSAAAPFVSGLAAVLLGIPGNGSPSLVRQEMENTALDIGPAGEDIYFGFGLIQMDAAIAIVLQIPTPVSQAIPSGAGIAPPHAGSWVIPSATSTFTSTASPSPTVASTISPTPGATGTVMPEVQNTPELSALATETPSAPIDVSDWWLPGCGILLILLGLLVLVLTRRDRTRKAYHLVRLG